MRWTNNECAAPVRWHEPCCVCQTGLVKGTEIEDVSGLHTANPARRACVVIRMAQRAALDQTSSCAENRNLRPEIYGNAEYATRFSLHSRDVSRY